MTKFFFALSFYLMSLTAFSMDNSSDDDLSPLDEELMPLLDGTREQRFIEKIRRAAASKGSDKDLYFAEIEKIIPNVNINWYSKKDRLTALAIACFYGDIRLATFLMKKGADINTPARLESLVDNTEYELKQRSPICIALKHGHIDIAKLLHIAGAKPIEKDPEEADLVYKMLNPSQDCLIM